MPPSRAALAVKHARVRELAAKNVPTAVIARTLGMDRREVRKVRNAADLPAPPRGYERQPLTLEEKWAERTRPLADGHLEWTGERQNASRTPVLRYRGRSYSPAAIAFRMQHGVAPVGQAFSGCGTRHCVAPAHVDDTARRIRDRNALRVVLGTAARPAVCRRAGHDQSVHGRIQPNGAAYCQACKRGDKAAARLAAGNSSPADTR
ncbi:hypothetical protein ACFYS8_13295 [Kitasatospora sp. NPDC004615]|uniref:hypothetical protein n=1 Tax=unclassified Kitasatospora TaxID=2633591 RepID=UPI0036CE770E